MISKERSARQIDRLLSEGATLALLGDQHAGTKGCWVDFFGRPASCHKAIALFTLVNRAPLLVGYSRRTTGPLHFELGLTGIADPAEGGEEQQSVLALTQWYNRQLEGIILREPSQYWWLHRRWKPPRQARERSSAARAAA
jgi:KDO2-lipid IV(A) lauroyltransferase